MPKTLKFILQDTVYIGQRRANYTSQAKGRFTFKKEDDWVIFEVEPTISEDTWQRANQLLGSTRLRYTANRAVAKQGRYLLSGLLVCRDCGVKLYCYPYSNMASPRYTCKTCKIKVSEDVVEHALQYMLSRISLSPESLSGEDDNGTKLQDKRDRLELLKRALKKVDKLIDTLISLVDNSRIDEETFSSRFEPLSKDKTT